MFRLFLIALLLLLHGCAVTLHGQQTTGGGQSATTLGSSVQGGARIGNARIGGSFGAPPPANAAGGQITFSRGASAALVLGVLIAGAIDEIGGWFRSPAPVRVERLPETGISHTCSCYGWQPQLTPEAAAQ
ncbi:MAG: hypothetical protein KF804_04040 [Burkholderiales bacterium]|jgi:hypothetical protein|nr:hypothetical protein [Burkholderiales bacterium]